MRLSQQSIACEVRLNAMAWRLRGNDKGPSLHSAHRDYDINVSTFGTGKNEQEQTKNEPRTAQRTPIKNEKNEKKEKKGKATILFFSVSDSTQER
jgi:hypothetical protein